MDVLGCAPLVRLVSLDDCPVFRRDVGQVALDVVSELVGMHANRDFRLTRTLPLSFRTPTDEVLGHVVEGGAEVGEDIPGDEAPKDRHFLDALNVECKTVELGVELFSEPERWFGVEIDPSPDTVIEFVEVMLCPVELVPTAFVEPTHGTHEMQDGCVMVVRRGKPLVPTRPLYCRSPTRRRCAGPRGGAGGRLVVHPRFGVAGKLDYLV